MEKVIYDRFAKFIDLHWWSKGKNSIIRNVIKQLRLPDNAQILEAGCGVGGNLALLSEFGTVKAFEPSPHTATHLQQFKEIAEILPGSLPDEIPFGTDSFDLIIALDVLEHVKNDKQAVVNLAKRLKNDGTLLLTVPSYQWLWTKTADEDEHHYRRYTRERLCATCQEAGLNVVASSYFNTFLFPLAAPIRLIDRFTGMSLSALNDELPFYNTLFSKIFSFEQHFIPKPGLPFGLSTLCLAKPR